MLSSFKSGLAAAALAAGMLFSCASGAFAAESDAAPEAQKIRILQEKNIVRGYGDDDLGLDRAVSRAELSKLIVLAMGLKDSADAAKSLPSPFPDVADAHWAKGYIAALEGANAKRPAPVLNGYADGKFQPDRKASYGEVAKILVVLDDKEARYPDPSEPWPDGWMHRARELGLAPEDVAGNAPAPRRDVFVMLYDAMADEEGFATLVVPPEKEKAPGFSDYKDSFNTRSTFDHRVYQKELLKLINDARASAGQKPLRLTVDLEQGAYVRAKELALYGNMRIRGNRHVRPDGTPYYTAYTYLPVLNPRYFVGENLIQVPLKKEMDENTRQIMTDPVYLAHHSFNAWWKSPGHRENMLSPLYSTVNVQLYAGEEMREEPGAKNVGILVGATAFCR